MKKIRKSVEFEIKCRKYLVNRLETLRKDIEKTVNKEKEGRKARVEKLCEYKDSYEASEAYGYGDITEDEYREILEHLEEGADFVEFTKTPKAAALEILREFMQRQKQEINDFEWEMKSPEERERILKERAEWRTAHGLV